MLYLPGRRPPIAGDVSRGSRRRTAHCPAAARAGLNRAGGRDRTFLVLPPLCMVSLGGNGNRAGCPGLGRPGAERACTRASTTPRRRARAGDGGRRRRDAGGGPSGAGGRLLTGYLGEAPGSSSHRPGNGRPAPGGRGSTVPGLAAAAGACVSASPTAQVASSSGRQAPLAGRSAAATEAGRARVAPAPGSWPGAVGHLAGAHWRAPPPTGPDDVLLVREGGGRPARDPRPDQRRGRHWAQPAMARRLRPTAGSVTGHRDVLVLHPAGAGRAHARPPAWPGPAPRPLRGRRLHLARAATSSLVFDEQPRLRTAGSRGRDGDVGARRDGEQGAGDDEPGQAGMCRMTMLSRAARSPSWCHDEAASRKSLPAAHPGAARAPAPSARRAHRATRLAHSAEGLGEVARGAAGRRLGVTGVVDPPSGSGAARPSRWGAAQVAATATAASSATRSHAAPGVAGQPVELGVVVLGARGLVGADDQGGLDRGRRRWPAPRRSVKSIRTSADGGQRLGGGCVDRACWSLVVRSWRSASGHRRRRWQRGSAAPSSGAEAWKPLPHPAGRAVQLGVALDALELLSLGGYRRSRSVEGIETPAASSSGAGNGLSGWPFHFRCKSEESAGTI